MQKFGSLISRQWFLCAVITILLTGITLGTQIKQLSSIYTPVKNTPSSWVVFIVLFLMSATLDTRRFIGAITKPTGVLLSVLTNFLVLPILGWLALIVLPSSELSLGLVIAAVVPATVATASVLTRKAGGNDAISLVTTLVTNGTCPWVSPFWLSIILAKTTTLDTSSLIYALIISALLPCILGQLLRSLVPFRKLADDKKPLWGMLSQWGILFLIGQTTLVHSESFQRAFVDAQFLLVLLLCWLTCIAMHCAALFMSWHTGKLLSIPQEDRIAISFSGSQKTITVGILLANTKDIVGDGSPGLAVLPIIIFNFSQIIIDTWLADKLKKQTVNLHEN